MLARFLANNISTPGFDSSLPLGEEWDKDVDWSKMREVPDSVGDMSPKDPLDDCFRTSRRERSSSDTTVEEDEHWVDLMSLDVPNANDGILTCFDEDVEPRSSHLNTAAEEDDDGMPNVDDDLVTWAIEFLEQRKHPCDSPGCGASFRKEVQLIQHCKTHHGNRRPIPCSNLGCPQRFSYVANMREHVKVSCKETPEKPVISLSQFFKSVNKFL